MENLNPNRHFPKREKVNSKHIKYLPNEICPESEEILKMYPPTKEDLTTSTNNLPYSDQ